MSTEVISKKASWKKWNPRSYLNTYYKNPIEDTYETLSFIHRSLKVFSNKPFRKALEFGSGPAMYGLFELEPYVKEIHTADYLSNNLAEIKQWVADSPSAFNWDSCIKLSLSIEGKDASRQNINLRTEGLRKKLSRILKGNIKRKWPLLDYHGHYDLVVSLFCADSITAVKEDWKKYMNNLFSLANPGGVILIGALRNCKDYRVGDRHFPSASVNEKDIRNVVLHSKLKVKELSIDVRKVPECKNEGFTSVVFARIVLK